MSSIPPWNPAAVLPPIRPGQPGHGADRSPYRVSLEEVVGRFAHGYERIQILRGLIAYRRELSRIGIQQGFQWLDGSFMEHKEELEGSPPADIDVVTYYQLEAGLSQETVFAGNPEIFDQEATKRNFSVDALYHQLGRSLGPMDVRQISYYYSMWSHRRNGVWKGFLEVLLSAEEDEKAEAFLNHLEREGGRP
jgi:hypothetical protein